LGGLDGFIFSIYFFWLPENFPDFLDCLSNYFDSFYYFLDYVSDFLWIFIFKKLNLDGFFEFFLNLMPELEVLEPGTGMGQI